MTAFDALYPSSAKPSMLVRKGSGPHIHALRAFLFEHLSTGQSFHPSTRKANTHLRNLCSHAPVALLPPHVCHRQGTWQSPEARTCSDDVPSTSRVLGVRPEVTNLSIIVASNVELCARVSARV